MSRKDEYINLLNELEHTPVELEYTLTRAKAKAKSRKRKRFFTISLSSMATILIVFTIALNTSITIVQASARIPVLKDFAQLLTFSPSLSAAIENEYIQPIKQEQVKKDIIARVEYVIVDQKQLNVFYSLDSKVYAELDARLDVKALGGEDFEGYAFSSPRTEENGELNHMSVDFMDTDMPNGIELVLKVNAKEEFNMAKPVKVSDGLLSKGVKEAEPNYIVEFSFKLEFDPHYTGQGEMIILNQEFEIDDQLLRATTIEIYPSHIRLNFSNDKSNTAWLKSLDFYIENERGERYQAISNGISATGSPDSPMMVSHRLESSFFSKSKSLTLYIKGITWLDKDMEKVKLDLKNEAIEALPPDVTLETAKRVEDSWLLTFSAKEPDEGVRKQLWDMKYYDLEGKEYSINAYSLVDGGYYDEEKQEYIETPGNYQHEFALVDYPYDVVYLCPSYSRIVDLPIPIKIRIK